MNEKNVWLSSRELQQMLQGSLHWNDVAPRVSSSTGMRKLGEAIPEKRADPSPSDQVVVKQPLEQEVDRKSVV